ncbi:MAG: hypothetical protein WKF37_07210 [Bryobacteraceae bacterium]
MSPPGVFSDKGTHRHNRRHISETGVIRQVGQIEASAYAKPTHTGKWHLRAYADRRDQPGLMSIVIENQSDPLSFPHPVLPGALVMAFRESRLREIGLMAYRKQRQTLTVRAVLTDKPQPSNCSLEEVVTFAPNTHVILTEGPFPRSNTIPTEGGPVRSVV